MMTSLNNAVPPKRDLHVGGVGSEPSAALATADAPSVLFDATQSLLRAADDLVFSAQQYVRSNPLAAIGMVGLAGLAAGYLLSRRDSISGRGT